MMSMSEMEEKLHMHDNALMWIGIVVAILLALKLCDMAGFETNFKPNNRPVINFPSWKSVDNWTSRDPYDMQDQLTPEQVKALQSRRGTVINFPSWRNVG